MPRFRPEFTACLTDSHSFLLLSSFPWKMKAAPCSATDQFHVQQGDDFKPVVQAIPSAIMWFVFFQRCGNTMWSKRKVVRQVEIHFCPGFSAAGMSLEHQERGKTGNTLTWNRNMAFCQLWNQVQRGESLLVLWLVINLFRIKTHADFHALLFTALVSGCL